MILNAPKKIFMPLLIATLCSFAPTMIAADIFDDPFGSPQKIAAKETRAFDWNTLDLNLLNANLGELWRGTAPTRNRSTLHTMSHLKVHDDLRGSSAQIFFSALTDRLGLFTDILRPTLIDTFLRNEELSEELAKITTYEERAGIMLDLYKKIRSFGLTLEVPIYGSVAHLYAPSSTREKIPNTLGDSDALFSHSEQARIGDALIRFNKDAGIGDIRGGISYTLSTPENRGQFTFGLEGIIPFDTLIQKSKKHLSFDPTKGVPFDPTPLDIYLEPTRGFTYLLHLLETLQHISQRPRLGDGSWGVGGTIITKGNVTDNVSLSLMVQGYHLFPIISHRIMMRYRENDPTELHVEPGEYKIKSSLGDILRGNVIIERRFSQKGSLGLGFDFYAQNEEELIHLFTESDDSARLLSKESLMPKTQQAKVFAYIKKDLTFKNYSGSFDINVGVPITSAEIGRSWHLAGRLSVYY